MISTVNRRGERGEEGKKSRGRERTGFLKTQGLAQKKKSNLHAGILDPREGIATQPRSDAHSQSIPRCKGAVQSDIAILPRGLSVHRKTHSRGD